MGLICPICTRQIGNTHSRHHLIPDTFGGKEKVLLHPICHDKIHSVFTERELKNYYNTLELILENQDTQTFVQWVANKPIDFFQGTKDQKQRKSKRRR